MDDENSPNNSSKCQPLLPPPTPPPPSHPWKVYFAHGLSTWGDNMWWFAGGCYMMKLDHMSLRLTATYGLVIAASVICLGASIGRWIDRSPRLTAARTFLTVQNTAVSLCALLLAGFIEFGGDSGGEVKIAVTAAAIVLAAAARVASTGTNIILQKDWIVVIADGDNDRLAKMNSILRTIELTTYMLAPAAAGQLFTFIGYGITGVVIAAWNVISVILEYLLLHLIYKSHPDLAIKKCSKMSGATVCSAPPGHAPSVADLEALNNGCEEKEKDEKEGEEKKEGSFFQDAYSGWLVYFHHPVMKAGVGLSMLFLTVLGFDNITYGYCLMQGVPEMVLGLLVGVSALVGVAGSLAYPCLRSKVGLERTGLFGMTMLISCSSLAVISNFIPGSPMDLTYLSQEEPVLINTTSLANISNISLQSQDVTWRDSEFWMQYLSVSVFLCGIILARFGLWIVDLTVNQILQERVEEEQRGVVGGVQDALNNTLDLVKCILVIILPREQTFGILIFASYIAINFGWFMYAMYSRSVRGHLFHFSRLVTVLPTGLLLSNAKNNNHMVTKDCVEEEEKKKMVEKV